MDNRKKQRCNNHRERPTMAAQHTLKDNATEDKLLKHGSKNHRRNYRPKALSRLLVYRRQQQRQRLHDHLHRNHPEQTSQNHRRVKTPCRDSGNPATTVTKTDIEQQQPERHKHRCRIDYSKALSAYHKCRDKTLNISNFSTRNLRHIQPQRHSCSTHNKLRKDHNKEHHHKVKKRWKVALAENSFQSRLIHYTLFLLLKLTMLNLLHNRLLKRFYTTKIINFADLYGISI